MQDVSTPCQQRGPSKDGCFGLFESTTLSSPQRHPSTRPLLSAQLGTKTAQSPPKSESFDGFPQRWPRLREDLCEGVKLGGAACTHVTAVFREAVKV